MAQNIYHVKITLQLVGGWSASCGHFLATIGGFFLLVMDEFIRFYVARLQTKGNMKLQLGTSLFTFALIL
jgi:hypothetical protein